MMNEQTHALRSEVLAELTTNILPYWLRLQDQEHGGFYGQVRGDETLVREANKGGILNARILWSFSAAYRVMGRPEYLEAANRARDYILAHFIDREMGGTYWELDYLGQPVDAKKQFYALGFMLYGMSEHYRATGSEESLRCAIDLFHTIERHGWDPEYGGYIEALTRDWRPIADMRLSDKDANYPKSQNTHLHIIEPYTNLLRALKEHCHPEQSEGSLAFIPSASQQAGCSSARDSSSSTQNDITQEVEAAVRRLLDIFCSRILNPQTHHLDLFFDMDWSRGAGALESYGHDIECSWLMHESALVLGDAEVLARVEPIVLQVAQASEKGLNPDGSMVHEANLDTGYVDVDRHWWVQAETVVGFYNIYQHFGKAEALRHALHCWHYIRENLVDREAGEWYWSRDPQGRINRVDDKAGFWKCPYHNTRMCLELIERCR